jgi:hypothetical protein
MSGTAPREAGSASTGHEGRAGDLALYLLGFLVASYIFYLRFPTNFTHPNFYAEDGHDFAVTLLGKGLRGALFQRFNGYYVWGIWLVARAGILLNRVLYTGELVTLPQSFALASYAFFGFVASMPLWLFRGWLPLRYRLPWVLLSSFVPLLSFDYAILGTVGNVKFAFVYIAFLLAVARHKLPERSPWAFALDAGILVCAYTNATVYLLTPFLLLRYAPLLRGERLGAWRTLQRDPSFWSLLILALLMVPQVVVVVLRGVPKMPGYLDTPFPWKQRVIEVFVHRSFGFALLYWLPKMNNVIAVTAFVVLVALGLGASRGETRRLLLFALAAILVTTGLLIATRPGIGGTFAHYQNGGADQFFYPQNWIFYFFFVVTLHALFERRADSPLARWAPVAILLIFLVPVSKAGSWGTNGEMKEYVGTIYDRAPEACATGKEMVSVPIYPRDGWTITVPRGALCTQALSQLTRQRP